jgi:MFS family permease
MTVFIDLLGFGILIPILPVFASKQLHISDFGIGVLFASFSFVQFIFNPILGKLSDKYGRRPLILISLCCTITSYIIFSFAGSFFILLVSRLLGGFGGSNISVAQAYIADITPKSHRSKGMGLIGMAFGLGFVFGPVVGGILSGYGYSVAGFGSAAFSTIALIFAFFVLQESLKKEDREKVEKANQKVFDLKEAVRILRHPDIGLLILLFFVVTFSGANIFGTYALLGYKLYGFTNIQIGYLFGILGIVGAVVQGGLIRILSRKFSDKVLILAGSFLMIFGIGLMPYSINFLGMAITVSILSIGTGIVQPIVLAMVSKYSPDEDQGVILGINQSLSALGRVLGPLWGGFAFDFLGYQFPFLTGSAFMLLTFIFSVFLLRDKKYSVVNKHEVEFAGADLNKISKSD